MTAGPWALSPLDTTYALAVDDRGVLRHLYWGARVEPTADLTPAPLWDLSTNDLYDDIAPAEYPAHGGFRTLDAAVAVTAADGTRQTVLDVLGVDGADPLVVHLADSVTGLAVELHYATVPGHALLRRWAVLRNTGTAPLTVTRAASALLFVPHDDLWLHNVHGLWAAEQQPYAQPVGHTRLVLDSRKGVSTHNHNPAFVLAPADTTETAGPAWFGALEYPGNFAIVVTPSPYGGVGVRIGMNDHDTAIPLGPGESLTTPTAVAGYTDGGFGEVSRIMHSYGRSLMRPEPRPVLYNSWEATGFDVDAGNQLRLAELAARAGAELFVVDDGWFGRRGADADGLGDWWPSAKKFPDGLDPLIAGVRDLGLRFGLWVEPEMVSPRSDLYAAHPDWIHADPHREPQTSRDQFVLDLTRRDVQDFVVDTVSGLLARHDIDYLKWDANRPIGQVGPDPAVWWQHTVGFIDIVSRIRSAHPDVLIEACASGGGRIDLGTLQLFDDFWTSDNTDALDRLTIQRGYSLMYPPKAMRAWVTDSPNFLTQRSIPLAFRCHVAMMGSLGIGADLTSFSDDEMAELAKWVARYKDLRPTIQEGVLHRLANPSPNPYQLYQYASADQSVLFVFLPASRVGRRGTRARLRGLDPAARYRFTANWQTHEKSGSWLMGHGIDLWLQGDYASEVVVVDRVG